MEYINEEKLTQNQKKLLDLKIRLVKAYFEFNFSLTGFNYLNDNKLDQKSKDRIFMDSYLSLMTDNLLDFVKKIDKKQINSLTYEKDDISIVNFLKGLEDIKKLDDEEIKVQKTRIEKKIKKIKGAANDIEYILLGSLPRNYYRS